MVVNSNSVRASTKSPLCGESSECCDKGATENKCVVQMRYNGQGMGGLDHCIRVHQRGFDRCSIKSRHKGKDTRSRREPEATNKRS